MTGQPPDMKYELLGLSTTSTITTNITTIYTTTTTTTVRDLIKIQDLIHVHNDELQFELVQRRCTIVVAP